MFRTGYETFVDRPDELLSGKEIELEIMDCKQYRHKVVKAFVFPPEVEAGEGDNLWVRGSIGYLVSEVPWKIKITSIIQER